MALAIRGGPDVHQCKKCARYLSTHKNALKHARQVKNCQMSEYRFAFADGRYFCYIDGEEFSNSFALLTHLACDHRHDQGQLRKWDIDLDAVTLQVDVFAEKEHLK